MQGSLLNEGAHYFGSLVWPGNFLLSKSLESVRPLSNYSKTVEGELHYNKNFQVRRSERKILALQIEIVEMQPLHQIHHH